jgi:hypothetical protein
MQVTVLIPVFNDWDSLRVLLGNLEDELDRAGHVWRVVVLDDASTTPCPTDLLAGRVSLRDRVSVLAMRRNLGHQRAIAIGLAYVHDHVPCDAVVVMDGDGEDSASDVPRLLDECERQVGRVVVFAGRARRSESWPFRVGYFGFRTLHRLLTGQRVRVGNFSVVPRSALRRLIVVSELWNHYAAAVFRSRIPYAIIPTDRGRRIAGRPTMNWTSLVVHGLSAIAVYSDVLGVRLLSATLVLSVLLVMALAAVVAVRLGTNLAVPGWATYAVGLLAAMLLQAVMSVVMFTFFILWNRNSVSFLPVRDYRYFIVSFGPACSEAATDVGDEPLAGLAWDEPPVPPPARPEVTTHH